MTILFTTQRMMRGFGVSVVVAELARHIARRGHRIAVGCLERDDSFPGIDIRIVPPTVHGVAKLAEEVDATVVAAHTSPFLELLPDLPSPYIRVAWEHGDPTPELFQADGELRRIIADHKRHAVYPAVDAVIAISHFIAHDIGWPDAIVLPNGCNHVEDRGPKPQCLENQGAPLRVGTLMRLGAGEAHYKGGGLFLGLARLARAEGLDLRFTVMGRGAAEDAAAFQAEGLETHLNASDAARADFLRGLDVFVSSSLWEGCNLPLIEAQALGTPAMAFDTGAHPEATPLIFADAPAMLAQLRAYAADRTLVRDHGARAYRFVRTAMRWEDTADRFLALPLKRQEFHRPANAKPRTHAGLSYRLLRAIWQGCWRILPASFTPLRYRLAGHVAWLAHSLRANGARGTLIALRHRWRS